MKVILFILFSIISYTLSRSHLVPIKAVFHDNFLNIHEMNISIGSNKEITPFSFNQRMTSSWVMRTFYNPERSTQSKSILELSNGTIYSDYFEFSDNNSVHLNNFHFLLSNYDLETKSYHRVAGIGLAYRFNDINLSFIHHLHKEGYIDLLAYSFIRDDDSNGSAMFGGIPDSIKLNNNMNKGLCHVDPNDEKWSCDLREIEVKDYIYHNTHKIYFQVGLDKIYAPQHFIDYLIDVAYKSDIKSGNCKAYWNRYISCKPEYVQRLPNITFVIEDYEYTFRSSEWFENDNRNMSDSLIILNHFDNQTWVIGNFFLKRFDTLFDMENGVVELYSNDGRIRKFMRSSYNIRKVSLVSLSTVLVIGLMVLAYVFKINKTQYNETLL